MFGANRANLYWVGSYDDEANAFTPQSVTPENKLTTASSAWPAPKRTDSSAYYSFNPHGTDTNGPNGATRRLVFGWVMGGTTTAVAAKAVPYWQSAHSMARLLEVRGDALVQVPAPEVERLRVAGQHWVLGPTAVPNGGTVVAMGAHGPVVGDALELVATFRVAADAPANSSFGVAVRVGGNNTAAAAVGYRPSTRSMGVGELRGASSVKLDWGADIAPQPGPPRTVELRIFLDRSVVEVFCGGAALTARCNLAAGADPVAAKGVELWAEGGADAQLVSLEA